MDSCGSRGWGEFGLLLRREIQKSITGSLRSLFGLLCALFLWAAPASSIPVNHLGVTLGSLVNSGGAITSLDQDLIFGNFQNLSEIGTPNAMYLYRITRESNGFSILSPDFSLLPDDEGSPLPSMAFSYDVYAGEGLQIASMTIDYDAQNNLPLVVLSTSVFDDVGVRIGQDDIVLYSTIYSLPVSSTFPLGYLEEEFYGTGQMIEMGNVYSAALLTGQNIVQQWRSVHQFETIPEPATATFLFLGLIGLSAARRRLKFIA